MSKYEVKTKLSNITQLKDGSFSYKEEITSMKWDEKDRLRYRQSGKSMGEFGENYSYRKQYHHDYHDSSGVKWVEPNITPQGKSLQGWPSDGEDDEPMKKPYAPHVIEPFVPPKKDHEGHEYTTDEDREKLEKDRNYNIPIVPEKDIPPAPVHQEEESEKNEMLKSLWKGLV